MQGEEDAVDEGTEEADVEVVSAGFDGEGLGA